MYIASYCVCPLFDDDETPMQNHRLRFTIVTTENLRSTSLILAIWEDLHVSVTWQALKVTNWLWMKTQIHPNP